MEADRVRRSPEPEAAQQWMSPCQYRLLANVANIYIYIYVCVCDHVCVFLGPRLVLLQAGHENMGFATPMDSSIAWSLEAGGGEQKLAGEGGVGKGGF